MLTFKFQSLLCALSCRLFGPVFKWKFGSDTVIGVCEYDTIKSLLQHDGKVSLQ
jgi:hypothetical protein